MSSDLVAVTIGVGEEHAHLARLAADRMRCFTGCSVVVLDEKAVKRTGVAFPHWLRFKLFDLVDAENILFFDPDAFCLREWNPRLYCDLPEFIAVRAWWFDPRYPPLGRQYGYGDDIPNTGLFICNRTHHRNLLRAAEEAQPPDNLFKGVKNFDEIAFGIALKRQKVPIRFLDRRYNWVQYGNGTLAAHANVIVAHACDDELRRRYATSEDIQTDAPLCEADEESHHQLAGRLVVYDRVGYDTRLLHFRPDGTIGEGSGDGERYWFTYRDDAGRKLVIGSALDETCTLVEDETGTWHGRWSNYERMPITLKIHQPAAIHWKSFIADRTLGSRIDKTPFEVGAKFLAECAVVEDWGCGSGNFGEVMQSIGRTRVIGIDGCDNGHAQVIGDLAERTSRVEGIFMRGVLEHNYNWKAILKNALRSFKRRMVLICVTPCGEATCCYDELTFRDGASAPVLSLRREDILEILAENGDLSFRDEVVATATDYGEEHLFFLERQSAKARLDRSEQPPPVSIIIAARNNGPYLVEAITSALRQTVPCEVIYSDDCSTDDSLALARSFEAVGVVVLSTPFHRGVCETRNRGAAIAKGNYLVFLDGDDFLSDDFVEKHLQQMEPGTPFAYGPAQAFGAGPHAGKFWDVPSWDKYDLWYCNTVNTSAMYARWAFEGAGRWHDSVRTMWDWDLAIRASRFGKPKPSRAVLHYRMHANSWSMLTGEREVALQVNQRVRTRRGNARVSVGTIISGRLPDLFPRWIAALTQAVRLMKLSHKPELVCLDNSRNPKIRSMMLTEADKYCDTFETIRILLHPDNFTWNTERQRRDRVAQFMAAASNRLRSEMLGDVHWFVEDDILVPLTAGEHLWQAITEGDRPPNAVAGFYRNRHTPEIYVGGWWNDGRTEELRDIPTNPIKVDFTGTGCLMFWKDRTPKVWNSHVNGVPAHDWTWGLDLKAMGGTLTMLPDVRCGHAIDAERILQG